ncbi:hypothetical protein ABTQ33_13215 (plasmid) [Paucilactobacillus suebicus]|nr:hypothetical protein [Paucilactobacillus suebicus]
MDPETIDELCQLKQELIHKALNTKSLIKKAILIRIYKELN